MREGARGEEYSHDGTSRRDAEQDSDGACHPRAPFCGLAAETQPVGAAERQQEPCVEDEDRGALDPAADRVGAYRVGKIAGTSEKRELANLLATCIKNVRIGRQVHKWLI